MNNPKKKPPDKNRIENYEKFLTSYTTVKTSLKSIVKHDYISETINEVVITVNKIIIHTYNFLKLYCLYTYKTTNNLPEINELLINCIMKILCKKDVRGRKPNKNTQQLKDKLIVFYKNHYKKIVYDEKELIYTNLNNILEYEKVNMFTVIKNHITNHFYDFVNYYCNVLTDKKKHEDIIDKKKITKKEKKKELSLLRKELRELKSDIFNNTDNCKEKYNNLKDKIRTTLLPEYDKKKSITNQVNKNPISYLPTLIKMSIELEKRKEKPINCFPLRKNIIPKYIKLDTATIILLLMPKKINKKWYLTRGNTKLHEGYLWGLLFRTEKKYFKRKDYVFNHSIVTDGFGCSILLIRKDLHDSKKKVKVIHVRKPREYRSEKYVDELTDKEKKKYENYTIVGIDPGKDDLIYATNGETIIKNNKHKTTTFRYSQNQRRKETKIKTYMKLIDNDKKSSLVKRTNIKKIESKLSIYNSKSCRYHKVLNYIRCKNKVNSLLYSYYEKNLFRNLKWYSRINKQRSEDRMLNNFKKVFGDPKNVLICIGDFEQRKQMKYKEPTKGKSFRKLFKKRGKFDLFLVDEYNTSKMCHFNGLEMEKFRRRGNPRPWQKDIRLWHGLLRTKCVTNNKSTNEILMNRDLNGSLNIRQKAVCHLNNIEIPSYLCRKQ